MSIKSISKRIFEIIEPSNDGDKVSRIFDSTILIFITLNVIAVIVESFNNLNQITKDILDIFEIMSIALFTLEYLSRIYTANINYHKLSGPKAIIKYITSPIAIIDLLAILPFYLPLIITIDLRFLRLLRLVRLLRILKVNRYSNSLQILSKILKNKKEELVATVFITFILLLLSASVMYYVETNVQPEQFPNIIASFWWAIATLTTVGYGDVYPITILGKVFGGIIAILGIGLVALPTGIISSGFVEEFSAKNDKKKDDIIKRRRGLMDIEDENHMIICNCPTIDKVLFLVNEFRADSRYKNNSVVVITEELDELPVEFQGKNMKFIKGNPTRDDILDKANVLKCNGVFVLAEDPNEPKSDEKTFAIGRVIETISIETEVDIKVIVELVSEENYPMMKRAGTDGIVPLYKITDCLLIQEYIDPGSSDAIQQILTTQVGSQIYVVDTKLKGFSISDILYKIIEMNFNISILGIVHNGENILNPDYSTIIEGEDRLMILAKDIKVFADFEKSLV